MQLCMPQEVHNVKLDEEQKIHAMNEHTISFTVKGCQS